MRRMPETPWWLLPTYQLARTVFAVLAALLALGVATVAVAVLHVTALPVVAVAVPLAVAAQEGLLALRRRLMDRYIEPALARLFATLAPAAADAKAAAVVTDAKAAGRLR